MGLIGSKVVGLGFGVWGFGVSCLGPKTLDPFGLRAWSPGLCSPNSCAVMTGNEMEKNMDGKMEIGLLQSLRFRVPRVIMFRKGFGISCILDTAPTQ